VQINDELRVVVEAEVEKAIQKHRAIDDSLNKGKKSAQDLGTALDKQFKEALSAKNAILQLSASVTSGIAIYNLASKAVQSFTGFVTSSVAAFSEFETIQSNLSVVLGSAEQAATAFENLKTMAAKTPFSVSGLTDAAVQLKQTGTSMRDMTETLTMLGDASLGNSEKFGRMVANYAQIQSVGKTTAMDLKQFAQMGLPIYDVLRKMGVQGEATGEQIAEAFRIMTAEGSTFYRGMEAGAGTLAGKTAILTDTWKTFKAALAETSGMAQAWKAVLDGLTRTIQEQTDKLTSQKRAWETITAMGSGVIRPEDLVALDKYKTELDKNRGYLTENEDLLRRTIERQFKGKEKLLEQSRKEVSLSAARNAEEERRAEIAERAAQKYDRAVADINTKYAETPTGRIEAIEAEIRKYQEYLSLRKQESRETYTTTGGARVAETVSIGLGDEEREKAEAIIALLNEELSKALGESKKDLEEWQKVLRNAMGFNDQDVKQGFLDSDMQAVAEY
jgi:hypothetical protein